MTPEGIITIVAIVVGAIATVSGVVAGYIFSLRSKREEWAKEYREKRLSPLVDYVNEVIRNISEHKLTDFDINELEKTIEKSTNDQMLSIAEKMLKEAAVRRTKISKRAHELHTSEAWGACFAARMYDKHLQELITKFEIALGYFLFEPTDKNQEELMNLGEQILVRADEVAIKGIKK